MFMMYVSAPGLVLEPHNLYFEKAAANHRQRWGRHVGIGITKAHKPNAALPKHITCYLENPLPILLGVHQLPACDRQRGGNLD